MFSFCAGSGNDKDDGWGLNDADVWTVFLVVICGLLLVCICFVAMGILALLRHKRRKLGASASDLERYRSEGDRSKRAVLNTLNTSDSGLNMIEKTETEDMKSNYSDSDNDIVSRDGFTRTKENRV